MEFRTPHSPEKQGHGLGVRATNVIDRDDVKCHYILPSTVT